ncbi:transcriptional regulator [Bdellovibrio bacteriovorus]|uniref:Transcriptional regulator n=1 Tax=Bdellovibrio bacteriovorus TaxID=959 RepID=A0A150WD50_BDEBC|nr:TetR/AcrR family transcriptional regulator [Bdellovibrio bacteriovorus]KYG61004.1 transcriptional regulator [Bdellovibrio bacteriovorus]
MPFEKTTREHIVESADVLFYQRGFEHTSFADIANKVKISRGNFYHHFKTKDEILEAVIELRLHRTQEMLNMWEADGQTPAERISKFFHMLIMNQAKIKLYGCPVGTLCTELAKMNHASKAHANKLMSLFRTWLSKQFAAAGCKKESDELAMHILARSQGIATLANTFHDEKFIKNEVRQMEEWLQSKIS